MYVASYIIKTESELLKRVGSEVIVRIYYMCTGTQRVINNIKTEKTFKNEHRSKDAAAKKRPNTSVVGKINNYYEDIYIPPNNNTD